MVAIYFITMGTYNHASSSKQPLYRHNRTKKIQSILDAYGHLSARHPTNPELFIMPRNMAPATITKAADLVIYRTADASPVDSKAPRGYIERFIHSEIYRAYPHVNSALHSHTAAVLPYANSGKSASDRNPGCTTGTNTSSKTSLSKPACTWEAFWVSEQTLSPHLAHDLTKVLLMLIYLHRLINSRLRYIEILRGR